MLKLNPAITYFTHLFAYDSLSGLKVNLGLVYAMQSNGPQYKSTDGGILPLYEKPQKLNTHDHEFHVASHTFIVLKLHSPM
jgi:hypothetical protein